MLTFAGAQSLDFRNCKEGKCFWFFPESNLSRGLEKFTIVLFKVIALVRITYSQEKIKKSSKRQRYFVQNGRN